MNQQKLLKEIRQELKKQVDPVYREGERKFFKEKIRNLGVRLPQRRKIGNEYFKQIRDLPKEEVWQLVEKLLQGYGEEATIGFSWVWRLKNKLEKKDFKVFESWVKKYIDNWAKCDDFCTHSVGELVYRYPQLTEEILKWTKSKNRWVKRAAAVNLIYPIKRKKELKTVFKVADKLLTDEDDMVQKGYGWMLKEASNVYQTQVFKWVMKRKDKMPRTALRYAIEKMPKKLKQQAMKK